MSKITYIIYLYFLIFALTSMKEVRAQRIKLEEVQSDKSYLRKGSSLTIEKNTQILTKKSKISFEGFNSDEYFLAKIPKKVF